jgi:FkbM family methyltransferase
LFLINSIVGSLPRLKITDVGAMSFGPGTETYASLLKAAPCEVVGFEPIEGEFKKLETLSKVPGATARFLPYFIGDGSRRTFYECNEAMTSSLFEPNTRLLEKFQNLAELTQVVRIAEIQTTRLDDIPEVRGTDLLKVDVQGGELLVFQGAVRTLKEVLVIVTEVEFVAMYKDQPLFADIDRFLRAQGFQLHQLARAGRMFKPMVRGGDVNRQAIRCYGETLSTCGTL